MKRHFPVFAALCLSIAGVSAAQAAPVASAATAEQFLRGLYAKYTPNGKPIPFVYPDAKGIVDPTMLACSSTTRTSRTPRSAQSIRSGVPLPGLECAQDHLAARNDVKQRPAAADVAISDDGHVERVHFTLVWLNGGWRIHDIGTKDEPSLVAYLRDYKY